MNWWQVCRKFRLKIIEKLQQLINQWIKNFAHNCWYIISWAHLFSDIKEKSTGFNKVYSFLYYISIWKAIEGWYKDIILSIYLSNSFESVWEATKKCFILRSFIRARPSHNSIQLPAVLRYPTISSFHGIDVSIFSTPRFKADSAELQRNTRGYIIQRHVHRYIKPYQERH